MKLTGNTVLITGGGTGIGRGLAEALHAKGNQVIIAGRRKSALADVVKANPGMKSIELDVSDSASTAKVASTVVAEFPKLNVLVNNAGIQRSDQVDGEMDDTLLMATVSTNLLGPIRLTSALLPHLKKQPHATVMHVTSMIGFVPIAQVSVYCATKAALHSYALSQRFKLQGTTVEVLELVPPYVQTELSNGANDPRAMLLPEFIAESMKLLETDAQELYVARARVRHDALRGDEVKQTQALNELMGRV